MTRVTLQNYKERRVKSKLSHHHSTTIATLLLGENSDPSGNSGAGPLRGCPIICFSCSSCCSLCSSFTCRSCRSSCSSPIFWKGERRRGGGGKGKRRRREGEEEEEEEEKEQREQVKCASFSIKLSVYPPSHILTPSHPHCSPTAHPPAPSDIF